MKTQLVAILFFLACIMVMVSGTHISQQRFDKITVKEFELVDKNGVQRVSIVTEKDGEVVFRLKDAKGTIRVKIGASEDGSGLVLLDDSTNVGFHALARKSGTTLTLINKQGEKRQY
jgi:hypothetical protein